MVAIGTPTALRDFLATQTTLTLATQNSDGTPHACDVFYAHSDDLALYFLSDPKTIHIQNLTRELRASATIHGISKGWQDIRGVQIVGDAGRVEDLADRARGYRLYIAKYAFVVQWLPSVAALGQLRKQLGVVELYKLAPRWIRWIDNTQSFGHKEEFIIRNS